MACELAVAEADRDEALVTVQEAEMRDHEKSRPK
jgi:hypothetical protein